MISRRRSDKQENEFFALRFLCDDQRVEKIVRDNLRHADIPSAAKASGMNQ